MNGATAEPWLNTINAPNNAKTIKIGSNQYFFLTFKNSQNSLRNPIIKIVYPLFQYFYHVFSNSCSNCSFLGQEDLFQLSLETNL